MTCTEWEFYILAKTCVVGAGWPIHLGFLLTRWGIPPAWAVPLAAALGFIALAAGVGYLLVGIIYAGFWVVQLIEGGMHVEEVY